MAQQLSNPIPDPVVTGDIRVRIDDLVQMPGTLSTVGGKPDYANGAHARINFLRESPDGRLFVNDLRGQLYTLDAGNQPQLYLDIDANNGGAGSIFPASWYSNGLAAGFISYNFHPDFENNGVFYTIHAERASDTSATPDFASVDMRSGSHPVLWHTVITEWTAADPRAATWNESTGARREVLRVGTTADSYFHPFGDLQFNPLANPGDDDYGMMYISGGDWGYINGAGAPQGSGTEGQPGQLQRLDTLAGTMLRIDPRSPSVTGGQAGIGDYTIPADNPFVDGDANTFDEIYAFGFRNGHRMAWDTDDGQLYVMSVGHANLEEIERIVPGGNYGWALREGTFVNGNDLANGGNGDADAVFANNVPDALDVDFRGEEYLYPVVQYDHGEGFAIAGGFVYRGVEVPELYNKYIFGDIVNGRIFAADMDEIRGIDITDPTTTAGMIEVQLYTDDGLGNETDINDLRDLVGTGRADLRFGLDNEGELYIMTKTDGYIRRLFTSFDAVWGFDGGGNWGDGPNWTGGVSPAAGVDVVLGSALTAPGAPATVSLDTPADVSNLTFSNHNTYIIDGPSALTLSGPAVISATTGSHQVRAVIAGTNGLNNTGQGTVTLVDNANTYSGDTNVHNGTLALSGTASIANSANIHVMEGGTLDVTAAASGALNLNGQTLTIDGDVNGHVVATNASTIHVNSSNSMNGDVTLDSGSLMDGAGQVNGNVFAQNGTVRVGAEGLNLTQSQFIVDDFEGYALGDVNAVAAPPWTSHVGSGLTDIEDDGGGNQVITLGGTSGYGAASRLMPVNGQIADTDTATLFFRFNSKFDDPDHSFGLGDTTDTGNGFVFGDYEAQVRVTDDPQASGTYVLNARDGNNFTSTLAGGLTPDTWYNVWMVVDQTTDTYDVYLNTGATDATPGDQIATGLAFRNGTTETLATLLGAWGPAPIENAVRYDTVAFLTGQDLTNPLGGLNPVLTGSGQTLTINGDLTMGADGVLALDAFDPTIFDSLDITGHLSAAGTLTVTLDPNAPAPQLGDAFDILDFATASGAFDSLNLPTLTAGLYWDTTGLLTTGILQVTDVQVLEGDLNGDGFVGIADLNIVLGLWNNLVPDNHPSDPSGDNFVGIADLNIVLGNWNAGTPPVSNANIPEPGTAALLVCALAVMLKGRRRS